jgi:hypothetical protein
MNTFVSTLARDLSCAAASAAITVMAAMAFVDSTALPPGMHAQESPFVAVQPQHAWFGQPQPAVLVD